MRTTVTVLCLAALLWTPRTAHAIDKAEAERRLDAALRQPIRLELPSYLETIRVERLRPAYERWGEANVIPPSERGVWRVQAAVKVDVFAIVFPWEGDNHLLLLDNFAWPRARQGRIDANPILRALGLR